MAVSKSLKELILQEADRRQIMKGAMAAGLSTTALSRVASAQEATPEGMPEPVDVGSFEGATVNFMIIQPHAVTGDILKAEFEAATGATVNLTVVPYDEVQARATLDVQSGANEFDVIDYWYPTVGALSTQGIIEDITEWIDTTPDIDPADFIPTIYDVYTLFEGSRWGLPYDGDTHVLFYNTAIFEELGLSAPETWDDFLTAGQTITEAGLTNEAGQQVYGFALQGFQAPIIIGSSYSNRLAGFGGSYLTPEGAPALDSEAALQAAQAMVDAAPYAMPTPLETAFDQALPAFLSGQIAMMEFWTDLGVYAQDPEQSQIVDQWDVVQMPYGGANTTHVAPLNAGFCFAVSTGSQNKDAARAFIRFATSKNFHLQMLLTTGSGIDPMRLSGLESPLYAEFAPRVQAAAAAALSGVLPWPTISESPDLMTALSDELALMLQGSQTPEETMTNVQDAWTQILG